MIKLLYVTFYALVVDERITEFLVKQRKIYEKLTKEVKQLKSPLKPKF